MERVDIEEGDSGWMEEVVCYKPTYKEGDGKRLVDFIFMATARYEYITTITIWVRLAQVGSQSGGCFERSFKY